MIRRVGLGALADGEHDALIDVRSPAEYAEDHVPGAENLPVLDDAERARVGAIYVQRSKFEARRIGAALIARNAAGFLEGRFAGEDGAFRPLVYCWRGGMRSGALATILAEVGWRVGVLEGGYRAYRRDVVARLYETRPLLPFVVLAGPTGVAKTALLRRLAARGEAVLDLEGLARHRGSLFGGFSEPQPSQKRFEGALAQALAELGARKPVFVEDEASRIGDLFLPPALWSALRAAPRIRLEAPASARAAFVARAYEDLRDDPDHLAGAIAALPRHHAAETKARWTELARSGRHAELALDLIERHYDPAYARGDAAKLEPFARVDLSDLSDGAQDRAVDAILERVRAGAVPDRQAPPAERPFAAAAPAGRTPAEPPSP